MIRLNLKKIIGIHYEENDDVNNYCLYERAI